MRLSVVATPIGNMEDITLRAIRTLMEADLILCEDTRVTRKLLQRHNIETDTMSYHEHSKLSKIEKIIELLEEGKHLALVSDAGTPAISDPGSFLIAKVREHFGDALPIVSIPGPSALGALLSIAGVPADSFLFLGFLPHKKGRETLFKEIADTERAILFYESPHRILKTLESLKKHIGMRRVHLGRELTKMFEEVISGTPEELLLHFIEKPDTLRGEFVVLIRPLK